MKIDKLSTAVGTSSESERPYRYGYGVLDANLNGEVDKDEKKVYFEFSDYSTSYIFFEFYNVCPSRTRVAEGFSSNFVLQPSICCAMWLSLLKVNGYEQGCGG